MAAGGTMMGRAGLTLSSRLLLLGAALPLQTPDTTSLSPPTTVAQLFISSWFLITFTFSEFTAALSVMRFSFNSLIDWSFPLQIECDLEGNQTFSLPTNLLMYIPNGWTWKILLIYKCQATKRCSSRTDRRPWCREKMMKMPARRYWLVLVLYFVCCLMFRLPIQSSPWWLAQLTRAHKPRKCCSCWEQHSTTAAYLL